MEVDAAAVVVVLLTATAPSVCRDTAAPARAAGVRPGLADATGDNKAVREYLGLPEADPVPTVPLIPTQPGQPAPDGPSTSPEQAKPLPPRAGQARSQLDSRQ